MTETELNDPFYRGLKNWTERLGSFAEKAALWRTVGLSTTFLSVVLGIGLVYVANTKKYIPYFVSIDGNDKITVKIASNIKGESELRQRTITHQLTYWIANTRSVVTDEIVQKLHIGKSYQMVASGSPAYNFLTEYFRNEKNNPYQRSANYTVTPEITSILRPSDTTWQIDWREKIIPLTGIGGVTKHYRALIGVKFREAMSEAEIVSNPTGVLVDELSWSQINVEKK